jgi:hypothetical protein
MRARFALASAVIALAGPGSARAGDPPLFEISPPLAAPALARAKPTLDQSRALELEWARQDVELDQRQRSEERDLLEQGDLRAVEAYRARERRADQTRALAETLDQGRLAEPTGDVAARAAERERAQRELESRIDRLERRIRLRDDPTREPPR